MDYLFANTVLVLNKNWQAINIKTPAEALSMMFAGTATGLNIVSKDHIQPLQWKEWAELTVSSDEECLHTINKKIKIPRVILLCHFNQVPKRRPKFTAKNLWERDKGTCQYTGKKLSLEHRKNISEGLKGNNNLLGNQIWLGKNHTEETKQKMKLSWIERKKTFVNPMLGKNHTEETKEKLRQAWIKRKQKLG